MKNKEEMLKYAKAIKSLYGYDEYIVLAIMEEAIRIFSEEE